MDENDKHKAILSTEGEISVPHMAGLCIWCKEAEEILEKQWKNMKEITLWLATFPLGQDCLYRTLCDFTKKKWYPYPNSVHERLIEETTRPMFCNLLIPLIYADDALSAIVAIINVLESSIEEGERLKAAKTKEKFEIDLSISV